MTSRLLSGTQPNDTILIWIDRLSLWIELLAVTIIVVAIVIALGHFLFRSVVRPDEGNHYRQLKISLGRSLLLSLEILVAADIVRTVALEATLQSVLVLGLLILIRTFLSWALIVEIEGHWPWQVKP